MAKNSFIKFLVPILVQLQTLVHHCVLFKLNVNGY